MKKLLNRLYRWMYKFSSVKLGITEESLTSTTTKSLHINQYAVRVHLNAQDAGILQSESLGFGPLVELANRCSPAEAVREWKDNVQQVHSVASVVDRMNREFVEKLTSSHKTIAQLADWEIEQSMMGEPTAVIYKLLTVKPKK
jgi:hypothetical protein